MEEEGEERERKETNETETKGRGERTKTNETRRRRKEILMPTLHLSLKQEKSPGRPEGRNEREGEEERLGRSERDDLRGSRSGKPRREEEPQGEAISRSKT